MITRVLATVAAAVLLAGCTLTPPPVVETPSPTPTPTEVALPAPAIGVVGTGTIDGVDFEITWDGENFWLTGFEATPDASLELSVAQPIVGECTPGYALPYGLPAPYPITLAAGEMTRDVTFLTSASMVAAYSNDCWGSPVLSTAPINWTMQPLYPDLVVADSGDTGGARGVVTLEGETPVSYQVRQGDVLEEIAARFGLTPDQLTWLNPHRQRVDTVVLDETLNLSPSRR